LNLAGGGIFFILRLMEEGNSHLLGVTVSPEGVLFGIIETWSSFNFLIARFPN
jgi:hypothetical protein